MVEVHLDTNSVLSCGCHQVRVSRSTHKQTKIAPSLLRCNVVNLCYISRYVGKSESFNQTIARVSTSNTAGLVFGIAQSMVTPPAKAAEVQVSQSSCMWCHTGNKVIIKE